MFLEKKKNLVSFLYLKGDLTGCSCGRRRQGHLVEEHHSLTLLLCWDDFLKIFTSDKRGSYWGNPIMSSVDVSEILQKITGMLFTSNLIYSKKTPNFICWLMQILTCSIIWAWHGNTNRNTGKSFHSELSRMTKWKHNLQSRRWQYSTALFNFLTHILVVFGLMKVGQNGTKMVPMCLLTV